ncbi:molybdopterin/thiamine biosynthesis adenylyltransferase [Streptomyces sp. SAI-208]|nr:molybdopterin/thiamine biosynthesis adenylyltransferase [Streptomyces sp. SAI-208]
MTEAAAVTVEAFRRPRIKPEHRAYRTVDGNVRVGSVIHGIGAEIADPQGWVWTLVAAMDGTRGPSEVVAEVLGAHPELSGADARQAMADLLAAGFVDDAGAPVPVPSREEDRYSRGVPLLRWMDLSPRTGPWDAQLRLRGARVLLIGVGGTGGHAAQALVASGVGHVHCVDPDVVELSNLNRQPLYRESDLGRPKVEAAVATLRALNSDVTVTGERREVRGPQDLTDLVTAGGPEDPPSPVVAVGLDALTDQMTADGPNTLARQVTTDGPDGDRTEQVIADGPDAPTQPTPASGPDAPAQPTTASGPDDLADQATAHDPADRADPMTAHRRDHPAELTAAVGLHHLTDPVTAYGPNDLAKQVIAGGPDHPAQPTTASGPDALADQATAHDPADRADPMTAHRRDHPAELTAARQRDHPAELAAAHSGDDPAEAADAERPEGRAEPADAGGPGSPAYDLLVLAADRPDDIRRWANRVCLAVGLPWVDAGYRGPLVTAGVYVPGQGACWECLRDGEIARRDLRLGPDQDPEVASPRMPWNPASAVTAGLSGALLAHAALALLTGVPALEPGFRFGMNLMLPGDPVHRRTPRRPDCPACGDRA